MKKTTQLRNMLTSGETEFILEDIQTFCGKIQAGKDSQTGELSSLKFALDSFTQDTVIIYGDVLFRSYMLHNLLDWDADLLVAVDSSAPGEATGNANDLAWCSAPDNRAMYQQKVTLRQVSKESEFQGQQADGRWMDINNLSDLERAGVFEKFHIG